MLKLKNKQTTNSYFVQLQEAFSQFTSHLFGCGVTVCLFALKRSCIPGALNSEQHAHSWIFLCSKTTVKAHLCTLLSSACQVVKQEYLGGTPCFCFSLQGGGVCKMVAYWLK